MFPFLLLEIHQTDYLKRLLVVFQDNSKTQR